MGNGTSAEETAVSTDEEFVIAVLGVIEVHLEQQQEVLRLAQYVDANSVSFSGRKEHARSVIKRSFPAVDDSVFEDVWQKLSELTDRAAWTDDSATADTEDAATDEIAAEKLSSNEAEGEPEEVELDADGERDVESQSSSDTSTPAGEDISKKISEVLNESMERLNSKASPAYVLRVLEELRQPSEPPTNRLFASLLTSLVSDLEVFIANLYRLLLERHPEKVEGGQQFSWNDINQHSSLEDFKASIFDKNVEGLLRGSYVDWVHAFEQFGVRSSASTGSEQLLEVIQRRHVIVHNGGQVSNQYLLRVPKQFANAQVGDQLSVDLPYLLMAADKILVAATSLALVSAHLEVTNPDAKIYLENRASKVMYELLRDGRYEPIRDLTGDLNPRKFEDPAAGHMWRTNGWLALKRLGKFERCHNEVMQWKTNDLSPQFQLAKMALLGDLDETLKLLERIRGTDFLSEMSWLEWPLLEELRVYKMLSGGNAKIVVERVPDDQEGEDR
ncbi:hypothetical protein [Arthrobacter rhombi]|uniref:hypothetical protein n=1 Tax=Arthrobacter rhombi TaxID=71253 RepID=UPI0031D1AE78